MTIRRALQDPEAFKDITDYRSRIKCLLFTQNPTQTCVCGMVKNGAHTILKIKKRKVPPDFCFFSIMWGDLDVTGAIRVLGTKSRHFILQRTVIVRTARHFQTDMNARLDHSAFK